MKPKQHSVPAAKTKRAPAEKTTVHPRNPHPGRYDFKQLVAGYLGPYI